MFFLSDRVTLGFVRFAIVVLSIFVIASIPALVIAGRWIRGFGTAGFSTDETREASQEIEGLRGQLAEVTMERDQWRESFEGALARLEEARSSERGRG